MPITTEDAIEKFFLAPCLKRELPREMQDSGERPILYLLRRDLEELYRKEDYFFPDRRDENKAPFLACLGILAGIDLMARFFIRNRKRKPNKKGHRRDEVLPRALFTGFLRKIIRMKKKDYEALWSFRNALAHSYGLVLEGSLTGSHGEVTDGLAEASAVTRKVVRRRAKREVKYIMNLWELKELYLKKIIPQARKEISRPERTTLRELFRKRYESHGRVFVYSALGGPSGSG